jgi:hypothetical protein
LILPPSVVDVLTCATGTYLAMVAYDRRKAYNNIAHKERKDIRYTACELNENKDELNTLEMVGEKLDEEPTAIMSIKICKIPIEERGMLRYFVNGKRFFLFIRQGQNDFFGIEGTDERMIQRLKGLFEQEYDQYSGGGSSTHG